MRKDIAREIALFRGDHLYQVELFDQKLIEYFAAHVDEFLVFRQGDDVTRNEVWFEGYRQSRLQYFYSGRVSS